MKRSGWLTFSAVVLIIAGIMRVIDAIWAFGYHGAIPDDLKDAILGHSLKTYGWIWLIAGVILIAAGVLVLGPGDRPSAEISRWIGYHRRSLGCDLGDLRDAVLPGVVPDLHRYRDHGDLRALGSLRRAGRLTAARRPLAAGIPLRNRASHPGPDRQRRCSTPLALVPGPTCESYLFRGDGRPMDGELPSGE